jgi:hypothetical protein
MEQSADDLKKQVTDFSNKMNEAVLMAQSMLDKQIEKYKGDIPDDIKQQLEELRKKMGNGNNN